MQNDNRNILIFGLICLIVSGLVIWRVISLGVDRGDDAPIGSSHRADPKGTRALFESLARFESLHVSRNYQAFSQRELAPDAVMFMPGYYGEKDLLIPKHEFVQLDEFVRKGGRLVIAMYDIPGEDSTYNHQTSQPTITVNPGPKAPPKKKGTPTPPAPAPPVVMPPGFTKIDIYQRPFFRNWDVGIDTLPMRLKEDRFVPEFAEPSSSGDWPRLHWHSRYVLAPGEGWRVLYSRKNRPVMIERKLGKGSIIIASDNYFLSNQGLRRSPSGPLLAYLLDKRDRVIFDETHLNVREQAGVATLIRRYNLHYVLIAFVLVAILFIWRQSSSLVPPTEDRPALDDEDVTLGRDAMEGYVGLLRRCIPMTALLGNCYEEWKKSLGHKVQLADEDREHIERIVLDDEICRNAGNVIDTYRSIAESVTPKHKLRKK